MRFSLALFHYLRSTAHTSTDRARSRNSCQQRSKRTAQSSRGDIKLCFSAARFNHGRCTPFAKSQEMLKLGGIYKASFYDEFDHIEPKESTIRIIGLDQNEVFYDALLSDNKWTFSGNLKRKSYFYRMPVEYFSSKAKQIDFKELTTDEQKCFRPDLPMRFGRTKTVDWKNISENGIESLPTNIANQQINTYKIMLVPHGPKGGIKKSVLVEGKANLKASEIVRAAINIQKPIEGQENKGIGFFRLGFEKGLPSYYIGNYIDKAGNNYK